MRAWGLLRNYGMSIDTFNEMYLSQEGRCAICSLEIPDSGSKTHVDHCHTTGKVREILCSQCNRTLGQIERIGIEKFTSYMEKHK